MKPRQILIANLIAVSLAAPAYADTTIAIGTVFRKDNAAPEALGIRGLLSGSLAHIAVERFQPPGMESTRTRAEIGLHVSATVGPFDVEPSIALAPFDMTEYSDGRTVFVVSAGTGIRFSVHVWGKVAIYIEPIRVEGRLVSLTMSADNKEAPKMDRTFVRDYSSSAGVAIIW